jgi:hypothetical protein
MLHGDARRVSRARWTSPVLPAPSGAIISQVPRKLCPLGAIVAEQLMLNRDGFDKWKCAIEAHFDSNFTFRPAVEF